LELLLSPNISDPCSNHSQFVVIFSCFFSKCKAEVGDGGAIMCSNPPEGRTMSSCVFNEGVAAHNGGGIYFYGSTVYLETTKLIYFSLFNKNTATHGCDIFFTSDLFEHSPLESSYSTTCENRCSQYDNSYDYVSRDDWLPLLSSHLSRIVKEDDENSGDYFGCGINITFPCKSEEGVKSLPLILIDPPQCPLATWIIVVIVISVCVSVVIAVVLIVCLIRCCRRQARITERGVERGGKK
jgi:hypothetical protein